MAAGYPIDSVSNMYPAMGGYVFRLCAVLFEGLEFDAAVLRRAVRHVAPQFPVMCSHLVKTFFGYRHVPARDLDVVAFGEPPVRNPEMFDTDKPCFRLYIRGRRLAMDVFHANADGVAAVTFLKALLTAYADMQKGRPVLPAVVPPERDLLDPYKLYYKPVKPAKLLEKPAFWGALPAPKNGNYYIRFSTFTMDAADLRRQTKPQGFSINDFLSAAVYFAILRATDAGKSDLPVSLSVPIDLRAFFGSHTQRNFAYYTNIRFDRDVCGADFARAMQTAHDGVRKAAGEAGVRAGVATTYLAANNPVTRFSPRAAREFAIRKAYRHVAGGSITTTLSNLGAHRLDGAAGELVERLELYLGAGYRGFNTSAVGLNGRVTLCTACGTDSPALEKALLDVLETRGAPCKWEHFAYKNRALIEEPQEILLDK